MNVLSDEDKWHWIQFSKYRSLTFVGGDGGGWGQYIIIPYYFDPPSIRKISSVACGFNRIKIHLSDYPKSLIRRINEVYVFNKISI